MNLHASLDHHVAHISLIICLVAGTLVALPGAASAMSLAATRAPDGVIHVAIVMHAANADIAVSRSVGLMQGAIGTEAQAELGVAPIGVTRSVGLMEGARN